MQPTNTQWFRTVMSPWSGLPWRGASAGKGIFFCVALVALTLGGCRAHPISLAIMIAGDAIDDADVKERRSELMGQDETTADRMFGQRLETLVDAERRDVIIIFYPVKNDLFQNSRYIVELGGGKIVMFAKIKQDIDGIEDLIQDAILENELAGLTPAQCSKNGELGPPLRTFRSKEKDQVLRIYDIRNWSDFMGARYCVLRFDSNDRCQAVALLGVSATTKKDPIRRVEE
jgi:hypothetical protein